MAAKKKPQDRIKILFIDHTPFVGGAQICLAKDLEYINRNKFQPILVIDKNSKYSSIYRKSKVKIVRISFGRLKQIHPAVISELFTSVKQLLDIIDKEKPTLVVTNTTRALVLAGLAKDYKLSMRLLKRDRGVHHQFKLIARVWDYEYPQWLINTLRLSVDKFLFVSKSIQDFYKLSKPKAEVVYLASDIHIKSRAKSQKANVDKLKKRLKIEKGDYIIGYVGRLVDWKGPLFLLKAFKKIDDPKVKLIYFGTGKGQDGDVEDNLKQQIKGNSRLPLFKKANKLEGRVILAGFVQDSASIYPLLNCFVQASIEPEPFATNMVEAALSRVPMVATHIGGTPEFVKSGKNGLLVKPKDTNQLSQALLRLRGDKKLAVKLAANAWKDAQRLREEKFIKNLESIYARVAKS